MRLLFALTLCFSVVLGTVATWAGADAKDGKPVDGAIAADELTIDIKFRGEDIARPAKLHTMKFEAGRLYQLDLVGKGGNIDPMLVIQDPTGKQLAVDDDSAGSLNARVFFLPQKSDSYKVYAAAYRNHGKYSLSVKVVEVKAVEFGPKGAKVEGTMSPKSSVVYYAVKFDAGKSYLIEMISADTKKLDPILEVRDLQGKQLALNDDIGGGDLNARIKFQADTTGTFHIVARSFFADGDGTFTLEVRPQD